MSTLSFTFTSTFDSTNIATASGPPLSSLQPTTSTIRSATVTYIAVDTSTPPPRRTTPASTATSVSTSSQQSNGPDAGQTIGIVVGVVIGVCLLMCTIALFCWRRKKQKLARKRRNKSDFAQKPISRETTMQGAVAASTQPLPDRVTTDRHSAWPRSVNPEEIGVAVTSSQRQSFLKKLTSPKQKTRSILPISAPIPQDRVSVQTNFADRFFAQPPPVPESEVEPGKHISDATTIRTSANPPTPNQPAITVLRPVSTTNSVATSFEDDGESRADEVPPLPTFNACGLPIRSMAVRRSQDTPSRLNLEAGIMKNISKAISHIPMTPRYDNGYGDHTPKSNFSGIPKTRFKTSRSTTELRSQVPRTRSARATPSLNSLSRRTEMPPIPSSPSSPFPIPERDSSLRDAHLQNDEEWLLKDSQTESSKSRTETIRPPPLSINKSRERSIASPIRNLTYPHIPASASESQVAHRIPGPRSPLSPDLASKSEPAQYAEQYKRKPLPPVLNPSDPMEGPSKSGRASKRVRLPPRIDIPIASQGRIQFYSSSDFPSSKATLTPNRTTTGDLVLTVDM